MMNFSIITYIITIIVYLVINFKLIIKIYKNKSLFLYYLFNSIFIILEHYFIFTDDIYIMPKNKYILYFLIIYFIILFFKFWLEKNKNKLMYLFIISFEFFIFKILAYFIGILLFILIIIFSPDTTFMDVFINLH